jgi:membrane protein
MSLASRRHDVASPVAIRLKDWRAIVVRVFNRMMADQIGVLAGGIAFYAFLSVFPAVAAGLMVWGLFTDMATLGPQLEALREFAPEAFGLITDQMVAIANQNPGELTLGVIVSAILALWSASGGVSALMGAMNLAYHETEKRGFIRLTLTSLGFTLCGIVFVAISATAIAAIPLILEALRLGQTLEAVIRILRWLVMILIFFAGCAMVYRIAPSRTHARWRWIVPGALVASIVWVIASIVFSAYLANFDAYNATFGSLGAVAALLMWFWLSAYAICMGAELNSQLELFTTQDTTIGAPAKPGQRGAAVADHIEEPSKAHGPTPQAGTVTKPKELERESPSRLARAQSAGKAKP